MNAETQLIKDIRQTLSSQSAWCLIMVSAAILVQDRYGLQNDFREIYRNNLELFAGMDQTFLAQCYYSLSAMIFFVVLPLIFSLIFKRTLNKNEPDIGLGLGLARKHASIYIKMFVIMAPVLWIMAGQDGFNKFYPLYKPEGIADFLAFEAVYFLQFFAVEFMFRGFFLSRLYPDFGKLSVMVMIIPYSFIHIHKPLPEAMGSIIAGIVLGHIALMSRTIWPGVMLHFGVALSMDVFSLIRG